MATNIIDFRVGWWLGFVVSWYVVPPAAIGENPRPLAIGSSAPNFALPAVDGKTYRLSDFANANVLVVVFTCNHCPTAQAYEARLNKLYEDYRDRGVALVAISPNDPLAVRLDELGYSDLGDSLPEMKIRAEERGFEFPYLYDGATQEVSRQFGVLATPHVFIFDRQRKLRYAGRIDNNELGPPTSHDARRALEELLAGKPVSVPQTPVFGCSTKWSDKRRAAEKALRQWNQEPVELISISPEELRARLTERSEKYRLVNVWATWCVPCVEELDELVTIHRMYRKRNFELITIAADRPEATDDVFAVLQEKHCSASNYLLDTESQDALFAAVDPEWQGAVPYTMFIAPSGEVLERIYGEFDALELKQLIVDHLGRTYSTP
ncbi:MAG: hypothetical protein KatS3mg111_0863 [Pirellulaceae bacterium]|nr:MAG: hypothetical protein KatS3mg111_0863 [Pirellulaceae bacterium]